MPAARAASSPAATCVGELRRRLELEPALAAQLVREVVAAQPLHREERDLAGRRADLEHAHDVRRVELRGGLGLAHEPRDVGRHRRACRDGAA